MSIFSETILYAVVLYNQKLKETNVYKSLLVNIPRRNVFIWDNSSSDNLNKDLNSHYPYYTYSQSNVGVSYPYNRASEYAKDKGFHWIMLLDQDTSFHHNYLVLLEKKVGENKQIALFCPVHRIVNGRYLSPTRLFWKFTSPSMNVSVGVLDLDKYTVINSGLLVSVDLFISVGGYNPDVFLDYSDYQFLERVRMVTSHVCCVDSVCLQEFSGNCLAKQQLLSRFSLFCQSILSIRDISLLDKLGYFLVLIKRTISLMVKVRSIRPLCIMFSKLV